jgi:hypothetical protein
MNTRIKFITIAAFSALLLGGCDWFKNESNTTTAPSTNESVIETETTDPGSTQMESQNYKMEGGTTATKTTASDDPQTMEKELNAIEIESDFDALVE